MKPKFEEFNAGVTDIYNVNEDGLLEKVKANLRYGNENVGIARHYAARAADTRVDRVIHILQRRDIQPNQIALVDGEQYDIDKVDQFDDTRPPITKLSLIRLEKHREKEFA